MTTDFGEVSDAFSDEAKQAFAFVQSAGFSCVLSSSSKVRFQSDSIYFEVCLSERDGEVSIDFGRLGKEEGFSFTLFLRLVNPALEHALGMRLVEKREQLKAALTALSEALKENGQPILRGEDLVFERMKQVRWWDFEPQALKD
jgi:hypothetical protein